MARRIYGASILALAGSLRGMRMAEPGEEAGAPAENPAEGVTTEGLTTDSGTTRFTPPTSDTGPEAPKEPEQLPQPPEGVSAEDWAAFQKWQGEKTQGTTEGTETTVETQGTETETPKTGIDLLVEQSLANVAPEMQPKVEPYFRAFAENGTLTDEQVAQAAKDTGFSEEMVRLYMKGAETTQAEDAAKFTDQVGGKEEWAKFDTWATQALNPGQIEALNKALEDNKPEAIAEFVELYKASGNGPAPRDVTKGGTPGNTSSDAQDVFKSAAAIAKVTGSKRYANDPEYRAQMEAKIKRSNIT